MSTVSSTAVTCFAIRVRFMKPEGDVYSLEPSPLFNTLGATFTAFSGYYVYILHLQNRGVIYNNQDIVDFYFM